MPIESVFISYTNVDLETAKAMRTVLEEAGLDVWFAPDDFRTGDKFDFIFREIEERDVVVALLSEQAIASPWVRKEINLAVLRLLGGKPLIIIPCYLDTGQRLFSVYDIKPIYLQSADLNRGLGQLTDIISDVKRDPALHSFENFLNSLIGIPGDSAHFFITLAQQEVEKIRISRYEDEVINEALSQINRYFSIYNLTPAALQAIHDAAREGETLPVVETTLLQLIRLFARRADGMLMRFAEALESLQLKAGVTRDQIIELISGFMPEFFPETANDVVRWQAGVLIHQSLILGLLEISSEPLDSLEDLKTFVVNPTYDVGPLNQPVGRLVREFRCRRLRVFGG